MIIKLPAEVQGGAAGQLQVGAQSTQGIAASRAPPYTIDRGFETYYTTRALPLLARTLNQWASFPLDLEGHWCRCADKHSSYVKQEAQRALDAQSLHEDICAIMANYLVFYDSDDSESDGEINDEL